MPETASEAQAEQPVESEMQSNAGQPQPHCHSTGIDAHEDELPTTNGFHHEVNGSEGPAKRRRISEATPSLLTRLKPLSPPWKKVIAEGPSSFTQDGVRKSGRTNQIPLNLQPPSDKRQTRGAIQKSSIVKNEHVARKTRHSLPASITSAKAYNSPEGYKQPPSSGKISGVSPVSPNKSLGQPKNEDLPAIPRKRGRPRKIVLDVPSTPIPAEAKAEPKRRSGRVSDPFPKPGTNSFQSPQKVVAIDQNIHGRLPRIRFRIRPTTLPVVHPDAILRRPKKFLTFEEFLEKGRDVAVENGGLRALDDDEQTTEDMARREARLLRRIERATEGEGVLSEGVSSVYRPDELERDKDRRGPLRQYAHQDHLTKAVAEFRLLMLDEHRKHKRHAKRLAEACRDEWYRKQPKTQEEIEAEAWKVIETRYRAVVRTLHSTWENVRNEINRKRLEQWEAEEQIRVRKALNDAVDISTQKLQARRFPRPSEVSISDEDRDEPDTNDEESGTADTIDSDSNMSSSDSGLDSEDNNAPGAAGDEKLTLQELRLKYSDLPINGQPVDDGKRVQKDERLTPESIQKDLDVLMSGEEESDESVNMDDDLGSSDQGPTDEDEDSIDEDSSDADEMEDGEAGKGLLGFFTAGELTKGTSGDVQETISQDYDMDELMMDDVDDVLLIPAAMEAGVSNMQTTIRSPSQPDAPKPDVGLLDTTMYDNDRDRDSASAERSSQPTPRTTETKSSELDSASSVELQQNSPVQDDCITTTPSLTLKTPVPFLLRGTLREYQHYGLDWLAGLYANNTNGILADEMGLGKTIQTIALLAHLACEHHVWGAHLVIVPTSVMLNWEMEFKKWCPGFKILTYYGSQEERKKKRQGWATEDTWNVVITSYQLVLQDQQVFKRRKWHYMILDEAHNIKNFRSQRWQTLLTFNTRARLLLTGTPLQNNLTELWSLLFFLMPSDGTEQGIGGFADLKEFSDWFRKPQEQILENGRDTMDEEARAIISKLHKVLRPYLLRRMKADVEKQMPGKYEHVEYCRLSRRQRELYDGFLSRTDTRGTLASGNYLSIINCLMQLRKVCNHPDLFQERPILSSFPMSKSVVVDFQVTEQLVRRKLLQQNPMRVASLQFLNLVPTKNEILSGTVTDRSAMLTAQRVLMDLREAQRVRAQHAFASMDPATIKTNLVYLEGAARWSRFEELQHCVYLNALRRQQKPIYGSQLVQMLDLHVECRPAQPRPERGGQLVEWLMNTSNTLRAMTPTLVERSYALEPLIQKFACITPPIVTPDALPTLLTKRGVEYFQTASDRMTRDPFHEARMRLSVQFPDKRLLQYDCGKLQALDKLLRRLQSGGHRALIFTQMTKVLDILEQFLNIHGHRYLRLDGSTKIEQRQILTDRFNNDTRILAFILSSRSGGLGINLTGADTVIFYDLDWNPAMDKQCQDRCHRIGQTRDVHIYRLVSEHTIEVNILRKANQKRMLDDVVIQEGAFTTDYFAKMAARDDDAQAEATLSDADAAANAAMDRVLGGASGGIDASRVLAQAEDLEDVTAAKIAQQEVVQTDAADFEEKSAPATTAGTTPDVATPADDALGAVNTAIKAATASVKQGIEIEPIDDGLNAWDEPIESIDEYMLRVMTEQLKDAPLELPKDRSKNKKGRDHKSRHRVR